MNYGTVAAPAANIMEVALNEGSLDIFIRVLEQSGLAELLAFAGPYTLLAPTNDAFDGEKLKLLSSVARNTDKLKMLAQYHVLPGTFVAGYFNRRERVPTLLGEKVVIDRSHFLSRDILCSNGILHVIDEVLVPSGLA